MNNNRTEAGHDKERRDALSKQAGSAGCVC